MSRARALFSWGLPTRDTGSASREEAQQRGWRAEMPQSWEFREGRSEEGVDCALLTGDDGTGRRWGLSSGEEAESRAPHYMVPREQSTDHPSVLGSLL